MHHTGLFLKCNYMLNAAENRVGDKVRSAENTVVSQQTVLNEAKFVSLYLALKVV